jgi:hypothetical protein
VGAADGDEPAPTIQHRKEQPNMNMELPNASSGTGQGLQVDVERLCPECGAPMTEFDRLTEDGAVFIWYACTRDDCTGQWLSKKVLRMRSF